MFMTAYGPRFAHLGAKYLVCMHALDIVKKVQTAYVLYLTRVLSATSTNDSLYFNRKTIILPLFARPLTDFHHYNAKGPWVSFNIF